MLRGLENGPIGRRFFSESRLQVRWIEQPARSDLRGPDDSSQRRVHGGGAQVQGRAERHDVRTGLRPRLRARRAFVADGRPARGRELHSNDTSNYLGTYTFASLEDYKAGRPSVVLAADRRSRPDLQQRPGRRLPPGRLARRAQPAALGGRPVRVGDARGRRAELLAAREPAWSPMKSGSLTVRANYGYFYDWVAGDIYKQTLLVDGVRQRELNVSNPSYPNPGLSVRRRRRTGTCGRTNCCCPRRTARASAWTGR